MKVKVICTFPEYSGIFLNKKSKQLLLNRDSNNPLRPKYPKKYGHHVTLLFSPGQTVPIKYASLVNLQVVKHIYDSQCQLIIVEPVSLTYRNLDSEPITITNPDEITEALGGEENVPNAPVPMHITISTMNDNNGEKINHEYSKELLQRYYNKDPDVFSEDLDIPINLYGFCGMRCESMIENGALRKIERESRKKLSKYNKRNNNQVQNYS